VKPTGVDSTLTTHCVGPRALLPSVHEKPFAGSGIAVGVAIGVAVGAAMGNVGLGVALGAAFGAAFEAGSTRKGPDA